VKPVNQTITNFKTGDCMRACVASIFELPIESVPNFMADGHEKYLEHLQAWCARKGLLFLPIKFIEGTIAKEFLRDTYVVAIGESPGAVKAEQNHAVVWRNGRIVHDPHPTDHRGIIGEPFEYDVFVVKDPAIFCRILDSAEYMMMA